MQIGDVKRLLVIICTSCGQELEPGKERTVCKETMQWNVRESYTSIAKRVGVDEETIRKRIKRQEKLGAILGWRAVIHPNLIGCVDAYVDLEMSYADRKEEILLQLKLLDGVITITNFDGRGLCSVLH